MILGIINHPEPVSTITNHYFHHDSTITHHEFTNLLAMGGRSPQKLWLSYACAVESDAEKRRELRRGQRRISMVSDESPSELTNETRC